MAVSYQDLTFNMFIAIGVSVAVTAPDCMDRAREYMHVTHLHIYKSVYLSVYQKLTSHQYLQF